MLGKFVDGILFHGHRIVVMRVRARQHRVYCDGNLFAVEMFSDPEHAINDAIRKIKYIEGLGK